jgi:phosphopantothenoylcysteine synthetase/decarboxylase
MNVLVTAGNTRVFIDRVRCLTNIFTGRTGAAIALEAYRRGHGVTLLTSHPEAIAELAGVTKLATERWRLLRYDTFEELRQAMARELTEQKYDAVIHSAAVSDYLAAGVFAPTPGTRLTEQLQWHADGGQTPALVDRAAGKVKSDEPELWLRLVRAPKLIDMIRADWGFNGTLVKFKLEVGVSDERLLEIAEKSRTHSRADLLVANTLEGAASWAFLGPLNNEYAKIPRAKLAAKLIDAVEQQHR